MRFVKMHGLGNDFVVVSEPVALGAQDVVALCDRRRGIGADGVVAVGKDGGTVTMRYWNADGSLAEMCGNGLRCAARYAVDEGLVPGPRFVVATPAGDRRVDVGVERAGEPTVEIGEVRLDESDVAVAGWALRRVWVGNPHAVVTVEDPAGFPVEEIGRRIAADPIFPTGVNVEFARWTGRGSVEMRVWERGAGETLACGTGMVAAAALERARTGADAVTVEVRGGTGEVRFDGQTAWLRGPVATVFRGELTGAGEAPTRPFP